MPIAAGIDQFGNRRDVDQMGDAVACHPRRGIDDGKALAREPIKNARLAHVGPADNHNLRNFHNPIIVAWELVLAMTQKKVVQSGGTAVWKASSGRV